MAIALLIPAALRQFTVGASELQFESKTVRELLNNLITSYPDIEKHLLTDQKTLRRFVNVYVNEDDIRHKNGLDTVLSPNDTVMLVPSIAGGDLV